MADYIYSVAIQANSFQNNMADKAVWRINENSLYINRVNTQIFVRYLISYEKLIYYSIPVLIRNLW